MTEVHDTKTESQQGADRADPQCRRVNRERVADAQKRLVLFALMTWVCTGLISSLYPLDRPFDELSELPFLWAHAWVIAQAFAPIAVLLVPLLVCSYIAPRWAWRLGALALALVPIVVLFDCITFHWIGERFLSSTLLHIVLSLLPGLIPFLGPTTILAGVAVVLGVIGLAFVAALLATRFARRWSVNRSGDVAPITVVGLIALSCGLIAVPALLNLDRTLAEMRDHSIRHPLCSLGVVQHRSVGRSAPVGDEAVQSKLHGLGLVTPVQQRITMFKQARVAAQSDEQLPPRIDGVIVIIESLQHSLMSPDVMPNVHRLGRDGYMLRNHFSGGNASNLGIFSLLNGTEASYFPLSHTFRPLMNRLLQQAGYELGFYGGTDDWDKFGMSGFIKPDYYDDFQIEPVDWIASDQRSIDRATQFLEPGSDPTQPRPPRVAVVYLYSSHQPFASRPDQEVFQPAATQTFIAPYTGSQRELVWNRYRNSLRSLDYMIGPLLQRDRWIVIVGDHGESFMDDGTIGHGTRLSKTQNTTSAMLYFPEHEPRVVDELTMHADVLPTVLSALEFNTQPDGLFEGIDLAESSDADLSQRLFATFHYMWPELLLVGPWTRSEDQPFGYRAAFSTLKWQLAALNPVGEKGLEWDATDVETQPLQETLDRWLVQRFGVNPTRERATRDELFARYLNSEDASVRLDAVEIARSVDAPSERLLQLIGERVADPSKPVRQAAGEVIIALQKRWNQSPSK
ncbi:sulfatase-like hydrolase/transferase [Stieleria sp. TO1_6]|uniref:sulfatase-like hydrolase/transferase n=1 Tax=Stieleria tagensis TaxID=2956795 RepID=UPI00209B48E3|nr:sulfatase-like hydrolase/transferase [Stieleria tagensis]MCO8122212.1 sulfatase-like hydrolase/transferase [Stieleria tagensis]